MKRILGINLIIVFALLIAMSANAQHLVYSQVMVDIRAYPEFIFGRGGPEGYSGAYTQINLAVIGYSSMSEIKAKAQHVTSGFEVTLKEDDLSCIGVFPGIDQQFYTFLRPLGWMTGQWNFILNYKENRVKKTETATVVVPRFNFPPVPTGIQIDVTQGQRYLVWNSIGAPGTSGGHVEYRLRHFSNDFPACIDEDFVIRPGGYPYELRPGNRIAVPLPLYWNSGDKVRIENRVYDDNSPSGPYRNDRAVKDVFLP